MVSGSHISQRHVFSRLPIDTVAVIKTFDPKLCLSLYSWTNGGCPRVRLPGATHVEDQQTIMTLRWFDYSSNNSKTQHILGLAVL